MLLYYQGAWQGRGCRATLVERRRHQRRGKQCRTPGLSPDAMPPSCEDGAVPKSGQNLSHFPKALVFGVLLWLSQLYVDSLYNLTVIRGVQASENEEGVTRREDESSAPGPVPDEQRIAETPSGEVEQQAPPRTWEKRKRLRCVRDLKALKEEALEKKFELNDGCMRSGRRRWPLTEASNYSTQDQPSAATSAETSVRGQESARYSSNPGGAPVKQGEDLQSPHSQAEHSQAEHSQGERSQGEHSQSEHSQSEHSQSEHSRSEHSQSEHSQSEPSQGEHNQDDDSPDEYTDRDYRGNRATDTAQEEPEEYVGQREPEEPPPQSKRIEVAFAGKMQQPFTFKYFFEDDSPVKEDQAVSPEDLQSPSVVVAAVTRGHRDSTHETSQEPPSLLPLETYQNLEETEDLVRGASDPQRRSGPEHSSGKNEEGVSMRALSSWIRESLNVNSGTQLREDEQMPSNRCGTPTQMRVQPGSGQFSLAGSASGPVKAGTYCASGSVQEHPSQMPGGPSVMTWNELQEQWDQTISGDRATPAPMLPAQIPGIAQTSEKRHVGSPAPQHHQHPLCIKSVSSRDGNGFESSYEGPPSSGALYPRNVDTPGMQWGDYFFETREPVAHSPSIGHMSPGYSNSQSVPSTGHMPPGYSNSQSTFVPSTGSWSCMDGCPPPQQEDVGISGSGLTPYPHRTGSVPFAFRGGSFPDLSDDEMTDETMQYPPMHAAAVDSFTETVFPAAAVSPAAGLAVQDASGFSDPFGSVYPSTSGSQMKASRSDSSTLPPPSATLEEQLGLPAADMDNSLEPSESSSRGSFSSRESTGDSGSRNQELSTDDTSEEELLSYLNTLLQECDDGGGGSDSVTRRCNEQGDSDISDTATFDKILEALGSYRAPQREPPKDDLRHHALPGNSDANVTSSGESDGGRFGVVTGSEKTATPNIRPYSRGIDKSPAPGPSDPAKDLLWDTPARGGEENASQHFSFPGIGCRDKCQTAVSTDAAAASTSRESSRVQCACFRVANEAPRLTGGLGDSQTLATTASLLIRAGAALQHVMQSLATAALMPPSAATESRNATSAAARTLSRAGRPTSAAEVAATCSHASSDLPLNLPYTGRPAECRTFKSSTSASASQSAVHLPTASTGSGEGTLRGEAAETSVASSSGAPIQRDAPDLEGNFSVEGEGKDSSPFLWAGTSGCVIESDPWMNADVQDACQQSFWLCSAEVTAQNVLTHAGTPRTLPQQNLTARLALNQLRHWILFCKLAVTAIVQSRTAVALTDEDVKAVEQHYEDKSMPTTTRCLTALRFVRRLAALCAAPNPPEAKFINAGQRIVEKAKALARSSSVNIIAKVLFDSCVRYLQVARVLRVHSPLRMPYICGDFIDLYQCHRAWAVAMKLPTMRIPLCILSVMRRSCAILRSHLIRHLQETGRRQRYMNVGLSLRAPYSQVLFMCMLQELERRGCICLGGDTVVPSPASTAEKPNVEHKPGDSSQRRKRAHDEKVSSGSKSKKRRTDERQKGIPGVKAGDSCCGSCGPMQIPNAEYWHRRWATQRTSIEKRVVQELTPQAVGVLLDSARAYCCSGGAEAAVDTSIASALEAVLHQGVDVRKRGSSSLPPNESPHHKTKRLTPKKALYRFSREVYHILKELSKREAGNTRGDVLSSFCEMFFCDPRATATWRRALQSRQSSSSSLKATGDDTNSNPEGASVSAPRSSSESQASSSSLAAFEHDTSGSPGRASVSAPQSPSKSQPSSSSLAAFGHDTSSSPCALQKAANVSAPQPQSESQPPFSSNAFTSPEPPRRSLPPRLRAPSWRATYSPPPLRASLAKRSKPSQRDSASAPQAAGVLSLSPTITPDIHTPAGDGVTKPESGRPALKRKKAKKQKESRLRTDLPRLSPMQQGASILSAGPIAGAESTVHVPTSESQGATEQHYVNDLYNPYVDDGVASTSEAVKMCRPRKAQNIKGRRRSRWRRGLPAYVDKKAKRKKGSVAVPTESTESTRTISSTSNISNDVEDETQLYAAGKEGMFPRVEGPSAEDSQEMLPLGEEQSALHDKQPTPSGDQREEDQVSASFSPRPPKTPPPDSPGSAPARRLSAVLDEGSDPMRTHAALPEKTKLQQQQQDGSFKEALFGEGTLPAIGTPAGALFAAETVSTAAAAVPSNTLLTPVNNSPPHHSLFPDAATGNESPGSFTLQRHLSPMEKASQLSWQRIAPLRRSLVYREVVLSPSVSSSKDTHTESSGEYLNSSSSISSSSSIRNSTHVTGSTTCNSTSSHSISSNSGNMSDLDKSNTGAENGGAITDNKTREKSNSNDLPDSDKVDSMSSNAADRSISLKGGESDSNSTAFELVFGDNAAARTFLSTLDPLCSQLFPIGLSPDRFHPEKRDSVLLQQQHQDEKNKTHGYQQQQKQRIKNLQQHGDLQRDEGETVYYVRVQGRVDSKQAAAHVRKIESVDFDDGNFFSYLLQLPNSWYSLSRPGEKVSSFNNVYRFPHSAAAAARFSSPEKSTHQSEIGQPGSAAPIHALFSDSQKPSTEKPNQERQPEKQNLQQHLQRKSQKKTSQQEQCDKKKDGASESEGVPVFSNKIFRGAISSTDAEYDSSPTNTKAVGSSADADELKRKIPISQRPINLLFQQRASASADEVCIAIYVEPLKPVPPLNDGLANSGNSSVQSENNSSEGGSSEGSNSETSNSEGKNSGKSSSVNGVNSEEDNVRSILTVGKAPGRELHAAHDTDGGKNTRSEYSSARSIADDGLPHSCEEAFERYDAEQETVLQQQEHELLQLGFSKQQPQRIHEPQKHAVHKPSNAVPSTVVCVSAMQTMSAFYDSNHLQQYIAFPVPSTLIDYILAHYSVQGPFIFKRDATTAAEVADAFDIVPAALTPGHLQQQQQSSAGAGGGKQLVDPQAQEKEQQRPAQQLRSVSSSFSGAEEAKKFGWLPASPSSRTSVEIRRLAAAAAANGEGGGGERGQSSEDEQTVSGIDSTSNNIKSTAAAQSAAEDSSTARGTVAAREKTQDRTAVRVGVCFRSAESGVVKKTNKQQQRRAAVETTGTQESVQHRDTAGTNTPVTEEAEKKKKGDAFKGKEHAQIEVGELVFHALPSLLGQHVGGRTRGMGVKGPSAADPHQHDRDSSNSWPNGDRDAENETSLWHALTAAATPAEKEDASSSAVGAVTTEKTPTTDSLPAKQKKAGVAGVAGISRKEETSDKMQEIQEPQDSKPKQEVGEKEQQDVKQQKKGNNGMQNVSVAEAKKNPETVAPVSQIVKETIYTRRFIVAGWDYVKEIAGRHLTEFNRLVLKVANPTSSTPCAGFWEEQAFMGAGPVAFSATGKNLGDVEEFDGANALRFELRERYSDESASSFYDGGYVPPAHLRTFVCFYANEASPDGLPLAEVIFTMDAKEAVVVVLFVLFLVMGIPICCAVTVSCHAFKHRKLRKNLRRFYLVQQRDTIEMHLRDELGVEPEEEDDCGDEEEEDVFSPEASTADARSLQLSASHLE